jgi:hypothetical protein
MMLDIKKVDLNLILQTRKYIYMEVYITIKNKLNKAKEMY